MSSPPPLPSRDDVKALWEVAKRLRVGLDRVLEQIETATMKESSAPEPPKPPRK